MPGLLRKLVIVTAVDGLILQPQGPRNHNPPAPIRIDYETHRISTLPAGPNGEDNEQASLESHGVVGLLSLASYSFLISITQRRQVAQILGKPIYVVTNVAIIPLSSQSDASKAISQAKDSLKKYDVLGELPDSDTSDEESDHPVSPDSNHGSPDQARHFPAGTETEGAGNGGQKGTSVVQDVIGRRGQYGRFATQWFSKIGWRAEGKRLQGMSTEDLTKVPSQQEEDDSGAKPASAESTTESAQAPKASKSEQGNSSGDLQQKDNTMELLPKFLRTTKMIFGSQSFFFSYDYDITRRFGPRDAKKSQVPMHGVVDNLYFWNRHLVVPLIQSGHHAFVLPLMQGFVGQRAFSVDKASGTLLPSTSEMGYDSADISQAQVDKNNEKGSSESSAVPSHDFLLTLISRRSVKRPGLRYLRRGVDDEGSTAITVESEQILSSPTWGASTKVFSFLQLRGSIPLYFSQSPYSFKPVPVLQHSAAANQAAFKRHFSDISQRYGKVQVALLVDKKGGEQRIGEEYEKCARQVNDEGCLGGSKLGFEWFDFHTECRGMKFENVSRLIKTLEGTLKDFGETAIVDNTVKKKQSGVVRTNCMDCLDRTNVVQSAFAQRALEEELKKEGIEINLQSDRRTQWFNTLWADNGDAISKQYSSTAALKGDYTRTRKRNYRGALNDFGLTLSRYYNNIVNDYFSQAAIDYLLGNVTARVFEEFETNMMSADPGVSIDKIRQNAIDTSSKIVVGDQSEDLLGGWTVLTPQQPNTLRTTPFEESVLLLTDAAVYGVRFDWNTEKVLSFERVDLRSITQINHGIYITSTFTEAQMDESHNVGIVIVYKPGKDSIMRVNTRSLQSAVNPSSGEVAKSSGNPPTTTDWGLYSWFKGANSSTSRILAVKALPGRSSSTNTEDETNNSLNEVDTVKNICDELERAAIAGEDEDEHAEKKSLIEETDIISLAEARKRTGYLEQLGHSLKRLVWA